MVSFCSVVGSTIIVREYGHGCVWIGITGVVTTLVGDVVGVVAVVMVVDKLATIDVVRLPLTVRQTLMGMRLVVDGLGILSTLTTMVFIGRQSSTD